MKIIFLGAEVPSNRVILEQSGAAAMGVSFWGLRQRGLPKKKPYELINYFPENVDIYVHAGMPHAKSFDEREFEEFAADYEDFIATNLDRISAFTEVDHPELSSNFIDEQRALAWSEVAEEKFWPVYTGTNLESLSVRYLNVAIPNEQIGESKELVHALRLSRMHGSNYHVLGAAKPEIINKFPASTTSTLAWLSPMMRGETIVWDGVKLVRYPKRMKEQARSRYKAAYDKAGLDFDKITADDAVEISKLAIWSYQQLEKSINRENTVTVNDESLPPEKAETTPDEVTVRGSELRKFVSRNPSEMTTLPVLGVEVSRVIEPDASGNDVLRDVPVVRSNSTSLRMCDTCFVASNCPAFRAGSTCAYNLPVEIKTKEQLKALVNALVEMQGQRVAFAKFAEDLNGGYPDPNVGQEMDRFFKMLKTIKELDESKELMRVTVERQGAGGVLSAIFGDRAQTLNELPNGGYDKDQTNEVIARVIDPDEGDRTQ